MSHEAILILADSVQQLVRLHSAAQAPPPPSQSAPRDGERSGRLELFPERLAELTGISGDDGECHQSEWSVGSASSLPVAALQPAIVAASALGGLQDALPHPPGGLGSWDWPLSRHEKKARVAIMDNQMLVFDRQVLVEKLQSLGEQSCSDLVSPSSGASSARNGCPTTTTSGELQAPV